MGPLPFQVLTRWISDLGSEYIQTAAFPTFDEARQEIQRLCHRLGVLAGGKMLRSIELVGDAQTLLQHAGDTRLDIPSSPGGDTVV